MNVTCAFFGPLRDTVDGKEVELDVPAETTVEGLISALLEEFPELDGELVENGNLVEELNVTHNGKHVDYRDGIDTELAAGDVVRFAPPIVGGYW